MRTSIRNLSLLCCTIFFLMLMVLRVPASYANPKRTRTLLGPIVHLFHHKPPAFASKANFSRRSFVQSKLPMELGQRKFQQNLWTNLGPWRKFSTFLENSPAMLDQKEKCEEVLLEKEPQENSAHGKVKARTYEDILKQAGSVDKLLSLPREQELLRSFGHLIPYWMKDDSTSDEINGLGVWIHESVHFMDLNWVDVKEGVDGKLTEPQDIKNMDRFQLFLVNSQRLNPIQGDFPSPHSVIHSLIDKGELKYEKEGHFAEFLSNYIDDPESLSSSSFAKGMATELNAYCHGALSLFRWSKELPFSIQVGPTMAYDQGKLFFHGQRNGILFFLTLYKLYLQNLDENKFLEIQAGENKKVIKTLLGQGLRTLKETAIQENLDPQIEGETWKILKGEGDFDRIRQLLEDDSHLLDVFKE